MSVRIGEILIRRALLTDEQVRRILEAQKVRHRPFGELAESLFGVNPTNVEEAWVEQYTALTRRIDILDEPVDQRALALVDRRQAWQFRVLPIRFDGAEVMVATSVENLTRALRFTSRCLGLPCFHVLTDAGKLGEALARHFPLPGMTPDSVASAQISPLALLGDR